MPTPERDQRPDRFGELLECMADLLVETHRQRMEIATTPEATIRVWPRRLRGSTSWSAPFRKWPSSPRRFTSCFSTFT